MPFSSAKNRTMSTSGLIPRALRLSWSLCSPLFSTTNEPKKPIGGRLVTIWLAT